MKRMMLLAAALLIGVMLTGCGDKNPVAGIWYSDRDDEAVLVLNEDGRYSDGLWLTAGNYVVDGDVIILTGTLDGQNRLNIQKKTGKTVLVYSNEPYSHTYYGNEEAARKAREARQAAEKAAAEEQAERERLALQEAIVGYWYRTHNFPVEFTPDGTYISFGYLQGERQESKYEVVSGNKISVEAADGTKQEMTAAIKEDGRLELNWEFYHKATPLDLSLDLLVGEWTDGTMERVFTADGKYITKSVFPGFVDDTVIEISIVDKNTFGVGQDVQWWGLLSETEAEYQLLIGGTKNSGRSLAFITKAK